MCGAVVPKKAIKHFSGLTDATQEEKDQVNKCLEFIKFGTGNQLATFMDKHCEHGEDDKAEDTCRLTVGCSESTF